VYIAPYLTVIPSVLLCVVLGANNLSVCLGTSVSSQRLSYTQAFALASIGLMAGITLEGGKMAHAIALGIASTNSPRFSTVVASSSLILMVLLTYRKLPISLSQVAVGAALGAAVSSGVQVNWTFASLVAFSWLLTPVIGFVSAGALSQLTPRMRQRVGGVFTQNILYSYLTTISGVYASYTLGANTVGLTIGLVDIPPSESLLVPVAFGIATIIGMLLFSKGTTRSVAENLVGLNPSNSFAAQMGGAATVHAFTQFGMPVSVSQAVVGGIFGAAAPRKIVVRNDRLTKEILLGWTIAPFSGALLAIAMNTIL
jgi:PiT family inorganic phosphate transporter